MFEVNFDGLVGPTHNYAGLAYGNQASSEHLGQVSQPKAAALQGLAKMRLMISWGVPQAVLPPQPRPSLKTLRRLGFSGKDHQIIEQVAKVDPVLLAACYSASSMWTANAATVSPSSDCRDQRIHFTVANLNSGPHRWIEAGQTERILRSIFSSTEDFEVHGALPSVNFLSDEGAANQTRFCNPDFDAGVELFVYGRDAFDRGGQSPNKFPGRQTKQACQSIARLHLLDDARVVLAQQNPETIDRGVFHNDVISVGHQNLFLYHEEAFVDTKSVVRQLTDRVEAICGVEFMPICVTRNQMTVDEVVSSYLFNSQIVIPPVDAAGERGATLVCPSECEENATARAAVDAIVRETDSIDRCAFLDLRQSMNNGGGPACLRLRVVMNEQQFANMHQGVVVDESLIDQLQKWVETRYRDELTSADLRDPKLMRESWDALADLEGVLNLEPGLLVEE